MNHAFHCLIVSLLAFHVTAQAGTVEGFTEPYRTIDISAPGEPGLIVKINVREGETVTRGQVLVEFDTRVLQAALKIANTRCQGSGRIAAAQAELDLRKDRHRVLKTLDRQGHASSAELRRAVTDLRVATANHQLALEEKALAELERDRMLAQIAQRRLRSPIDGVVVSVFREVGESTTVGNTEMMMLVQLDKLRVKLPVSAKFAATLQVGATLELQMPELERKVAAKVEVVSPVLDAKSGTVQVTCVIDNAQRDIQSGMRCLVQVAGASPQLPAAEYDPSTFGF